LLEECWEHIGAQECRECVGGEWYTTGLEECGGLERGKGAEGSRVA